MSFAEKYRLWTHSNGTIYVVWTERDPISSTGMQTKRLSTGTTDWGEAEQYRARFIAGLKNPAPPQEPTISYLLDRYRNEHAVNTRSLKKIDQIIKTLRPFFGDLQPGHISNNLLRDYARKRNVGHGTILRELGTLKAALHYAEGNRWIEIQPTFVMPVKAPPPRDVWLTHEQVATLISNAVSHHIKLFIEIAVTTAARSGAILDLTWQQIDFEKGLIDFGRGYGNKRRAVVPINDELRSSLEIAFQLRQSDYVIEYRGKKVASIKSAFRRLCQNCHIKASAHVLRHTAATWLVMANVSLSEVARLLGDSERTVERVYGKHAPDYLRRAVNNLNWRKIEFSQPR